MTNTSLGFQKAVEDFRDARFKATLQEVLARLTGKSNELLSYEDVEKKLKLGGRADAGIKEIPLDAIIGSVGRTSDFTRDFLPRTDQDKDRWARVKAAADDITHAQLPPIEVYKVGEAYFVLDGNHRVSVARQADAKYIDAHVIEIQTDIPLSADAQPEDLFIKGEYADFLEKTSFSTYFPEADLSVSLPGQYKRLLEHIQVHQYFMGIDFQRDISYEEAVIHWYQNVYLPIVDPIREFGLLRWFPGLTITDLYLWVSEHRAVLEKEVGWSVRPEAATADLAAKGTSVTHIISIGNWRVSKMYDRYTDRLFKEILVPISQSEKTWQALEQGLFLAQRENAIIHGLHVVAPGTDLDEAAAHDIRLRFTHLCQESGINGNLSIETGEISEKICDRVLLTDLLVMHVDHPPLRGIIDFRSGMRNILRNSARPILAVPAKKSAMDRVLLAYDDHPKSREALFIATYLAEKWKSKLTVLTVSNRNSSIIQDYARSYLDLHELKANFIIRKKEHDAFVKTIKEQKANLVLMGGYSGGLFREIVFGSLVNTLLRKSKIPLLICK